MKKYDNSLNRILQKYNTTIRTQHKYLFLVLGLLTQLALVVYTLLIVLSPILLALSGLYWTRGIEEISPLPLMPTIFMTVLFLLSPIFLIYYFPQTLRFAGSLAILSKRCFSRIELHRMLTDEGSFTLYLRAFSQDNQLRSACDIYQLRKALLSEDSSLPGAFEAVAHHMHWDIESTLVNELLKHQRTFAIARPGEEFASAGAGRLRVPDISWRSLVDELICESSYILITADSSEGIEFEIDQIIRGGFLSKTIFCFLNKNDDKRNIHILKLISRVAREYKVHPSTLAYIGSNSLPRSDAEWENRVQNINSQTVFLYLNENDKFCYISLDEWYTVNSKNDNLRSKSARAMREALRVTNRRTGRFSLCKFYRYRIFYLVRDIVFAALATYVYVHVIQQ